MPQLCHIGAKETKTVNATRSSDESTEESSNESVHHPDDYNAMSEPNPLNSVPKGSLMVARSNTVTYPG